MPLFESKYEKRSRIYREQQSNINRNIQFQTDRIKAQDRQASWDAMRARDRATTQRRVGLAASAIGGIIGLASGALDWDKDRQAKLRQQAAAAQQRAQAPTSPQGPAAAPYVPQAGAETSSPTQAPQQAYTAPESASEPVAGAQSTMYGSALPPQQPLINDPADLPATRVPWGVLSIIAGALFFLAPLTSIAGIILGIVGLRQNVDGDPTQRKLNLIGIGVSIVVLLGFLAIFILNLVLTLFAHMLGG